MFKPAYKLNVVDLEKSIVTLSPTAGTWFKYAIAPNLFFVTLFGLAAWYGDRLEKRDIEKLKVHYTTDPQ